VNRVVRDKRWPCHSPGPAEPVRALTRPADADAIQTPTSGRIPAPQLTPQAHETDPILAAALFAAWSGDPAVVVASPPGAGNTRLVVHLAEQLHRRAGLLVAVAAQTRAQTLDVAERIAAAGGAVGLLGTRGGHRPPALDPR